MKTKTILKNSNIFLLLLVVSWIFELQFNISNQRNYLMIPRILNIIFLGLYYFTSTKKANTIIILFLSSLLFVAVLFALNNYNSSGMVFVGISRVLLIIYLFLLKDKLDKSLLTFLLFLFSIILSVVIYTLYRDVAFFYFSLTATVFLIILLSIAFTRLLTLGTKNGNVEFFCAVCIFLVSDAFFGSKKLTDTNIIFMVSSSTCYLVSYFLIILSVIKTSKRNIINC